MVSRSARSTRRSARNDAICSRETLRGSCRVNGCKVRQFRVRLNVRVNENIDLLKGKGRKVEG